MVYYPAEFQGYIYYKPGYFHETADFDPGPEIFNLTSVGSGDIFVQKLDDSGNLLWVRQIGGTELDWPVSINVDESGNVFTAGNFKGIVDFDPGAGTFNLNSFGAIKVFIQKLDPSGNLVWAKQISSTITSYIHSMMIDNYGNIYTTGVITSRGHSGIGDIFV